jgi:two-component system sensor histidine kinase/response regulator
MADASEPAHPQRAILIVDDDPGTAGVLGHILRRDGYLVLTCSSGPAALVAVAHAPPDLILLDIDMPEMTGYEVCERLKAADGVADIPVLFVSGRSDPEDTIAAFRAGAVDYVSKPFQTAEISARIRTHLQLRDLRRALEEKNEQLEAAVAARTRELADAHKRLVMLDQTKDEFLRIISHELRTPLNGVLGISEIVFDELPASTENDELRQAYDESRQRIESLLDEALTLADLDIGKRMLPIRPVPVRDILKRAADLVDGLARSRQVAVHVAAPGASTVPGDEDWLVKALHALLTAAVRLSGAGASIHIRAEDGDVARAIVIEGAGSALPETVISNLFETFSVRESDTPDGGVGLGPPMARRILSLFDASVTAVNIGPGGFRFTVSWTGNQ